MSTNPIKTNAPSGPNAEAIEAWNTVLFDKFSRFRYIVTAGLGQHGAALLARCKLDGGSNVLDIGCGFGDFTVDLARSIGQHGRATGVDAAARFVEDARRLAASLGIDHASFAVADAQVDPLGEGYDLACSRFGTMFFSSPVAAFRNIRRSLVPGGRLAMVVWREKRENEFAVLAEDVVEAIVGGYPRSDAPTCGPGPFSLASPAVASAILEASGFAEASFERVDRELFIGADLEDAIEYAMALGPAGEVLRLAGPAVQHLLPSVREAIREVMTPLLRPDGVFVGSSSWIVTARAAGRR